MDNRANRLINKKGFKDTAEIKILVEALKEEHAQRIRSVANVEEKSNLRMNQLEKENQELKARLEKIEKFLSEKTK